MRIGLISNLRSRRNQSGSAGLRAVLSGHPDLVHAELDGVAGMDQVLRDFAAREIDLIAVNGGDGTVQALLTELFGGRPFERTPALAVLPGGTTNMIAYDVGLGGSPKRALGRLLSATKGGAAPPTVAREVIRVQHTASGPALYGMFFGTAAICRAIEMFHRAVSPKRLRSTTAVVATLGAVLWRIARRRADDELMRGDDMSVRFDDERPEDGSRLMVLVTTLDRLILQSRPYWGREAGHLRYTEVAFPAAGLLRAAYPLMFGGCRRRFPSDAYASRNADRIAIEMTCPFTLDGELYQPSAATPVTLRAGQRAQFVPC